MDAIIASDFHLGTDACLAKKLTHFLEQVPSMTKRLILNGDIFDSIDMRRLTKHHWHVLGKLRKMSDEVEVIWLAGNHGPAEIVSNLLGVTVMKEYVLTSGNKHIMILHGDKFDNFLDEHPWLTWIGDCIYATLQRLDKSHYWARLAKHSSKHFLRASELIKERALKYAAQTKCDMICVGHTHFPCAAYPYYNSGCWTEPPGTYLTVENGRIILCEYEFLQPCTALISPTCS